MNHEPEDYSPAGGMSAEELLADLHEGLHEFYRQQAVADMRAALIVLDTNSVRDWRETKLELHMRSYVDQLNERASRGEAAPYFMYESLAKAHAEYQTFKALRLIIPT